MVRWGLLSVFTQSSHPILQMRTSVDEMKVLEIFAMRFTTEL